MTIPVEIVGQDEEGRDARANVVRKNGHHGIVAYTMDLHPRARATTTLLNATYGRAMNQTPAFTGTPENVHNGIDNVYWTASALSGTWTFNSTAQAHSGTNSIDATSSNNNREAQIEAGASIDANDYNSFAGWIYITGWSTAGSAKNVELRLRLAGVDVGVPIEISDYIDTSLFNEWQQFIIPTVDFASGTIDQVVIKTIDIGGGPAPDYYLDDMRFEELGGFIDYTYMPPNDKIFTITNIATNFVDNVAESAARNPLSFLGISKLANGILLRFDVANQIVLSLPVKCLYELNKFASVNDVETVSDGTTTHLKVTGFTEIKLNGKTRDSVTYRIQDDLSSLIDMEVWIFGYIEDSR